MISRFVLIYTRFERFWHWMQMALIFMLMFTGFAIHGIHHWVSFSTAVTLHTICALLLILLWIFAIFWHFTTGTWKHYIPTRNGIIKVARFYFYGIFKGERHPYRKAYWRKHNPLQALAYLSLKLMLFPVIWVSGLLYLLYFVWRDHPQAADWLYGIAMIHTGAAYALLVFVVVHVYMLTTGHSFVEHLRPMFNGFDEIELSAEEEAYLLRDQPSHIRSV
ncbi:cytochrome b/b6 domain-containing protein [Rhodoferax sp. 4810]|uniref:Cytochrome b/b6 domain-containing protein n=1 Tax=Thiospirillum jenense TaxID=1653858 RepID=A0A839HGP3_9GAMM|nr:cytochrome b/b6 domain-containing protein [Thiospirillum jenense]MBB1074694.1 cytochrome b/b6 domain-containing protein [Rhodoferax jenense]MBB1125462.1 cytochrome b/b6 domain-containing protein [Thiospirillum jenense]